MQIIRAKKTSLSMDLAPLIDVVFQLLVFFMLTSTFANPSMKLMLPKAVTQDAKQQERIVISIDPSGVMMINDQKTTLRDLTNDLQRLLAKSKNRSIHIKGDQMMPYHYFVEVMDLARKAGALQVNIVHEKSR